MNFKCKTALIIVITIAAAGILHSQTEGVKVGVVQDIDKKAGVITVASPTAGTDIKMGDLLYVRIDGKLVQLRATFPMMTIAKCKAEGKNRALWTKAEKGMTVYRYKKGIDDNAAIGKDETTADTKNNEYKIGDKGPAGGWVFYDKGNSKGGWRYLEAAPEDQSTPAEWGCYEKSIPGAKGTAIGTGKSNTEAIVKSCGEAKIAAKLCTAYRGGGKSDWFLPSKDELDLICKNLNLKGVGGFAASNYWSSSEFNGDDAWSQGFYTGYQYGHVKYGTGRVRAVRAFIN